MWQARALLLTRDASRLVWAIAGVRRSQQQFKAPRPSDHPFDFLHVPCLLRGFSGIRFPPSHSRYLSIFSTCLVCSEGFLAFVFLHLRWIFLLPSKLLNHLNLLHNVYLNKEVNIERQSTTVYIGENHENLVSLHKSSTEKFGKSHLTSLCLSFLTSEMTEMKEILSWGSWNS